MSQSSTALISSPAKAVSTPHSRVTQVSSNAAVPQSSPGAFRHPKLSEIISRQSSGAFTSRNVQAVAVNTAALVLTYVVEDLVTGIFSILMSPIPLLASFVAPWWPLSIARILLAVNVVLSIKPLIPYLSKQDDVDDIPLTPSQRKLLGLKPIAPSASTSLPGSPSGYITPPRYRRHSGTSTPGSYQPSTDRRSISANYFSSPLSTPGHQSSFSPSSQQPQTSRSYNPGPDSPFSPSPRGSPLFYKAVGRNTNASDFDVSGASFSTSTASGLGLGRSQSTRERKTSEFDASFGPDTPSPSSRRLAGGLKNYKWLYEKGNRTPRNESSGF